MLEWRIFRPIRAVGQMISQWVLSAHWKQNAFGSNGFDEPRGSEDVSSQWARKVIQGCVKLSATDVLRSGHASQCFGPRKAAFFGYFLCSGKESNPRPGEGRANRPTRIEQIVIRGTRAQRPGKNAKQAPRPRASGKPIPQSAASNTVAPAASPIHTALAVKLS
jgi:hypothetical protein